uniref:Olfactory receptor n=1 Tax=Periophthalmus magnuspinnatus TaxID=409849 RepID=A0A3B3Z986_9GOBI
MNFSVSTLHLDGVAQLYEHRLWLAFLFLLLYVFVMLSDSLVVYIVCSQRRLHQPMYVFVVAVLVNSAVGSTSVYPKLLWDLLQGRRVVQVSRLACLSQAFILSSLGGSSYLLLSAMAFDRYLSICHPMRYAALMSPAAVTTLLLLCWLLPPLPIAGAVLIAHRLQPCLDRLTRLYCNMHTYLSLSCSGEYASMQGRIVYSFLCRTMLFYLPIAFVLFSYGRIIILCLQHSGTFASKALNTCLPHVIVVVNYTVCTIVDMQQKATPKSHSVTVTTSILVVVIPTVFNPVVYGLKVAEIYKHVKRLLRCPRTAKTEPFST